MWCLYLNLSLFAWKHSKLSALRPKIYDHLLPSLPARTRTDGYVTLFTFNNHLLRPYFWVICHPFPSAAICWLLPEEKGGFCGKWERYSSVSPSVNRESHSWNRASLTHRSFFIHLCCILVHLRSDPSPLKLPWFMPASIALSAHVLTLLPC